MMANPLPILVFTAAFAALGIQGWSGDFHGTGIFVIGVFCGSAVWAPIMVGIVTAFKPQLDSHRLRWINRLSGVSRDRRGSCNLYRCNDTSPLTKCK